MKQALVVGGDSVLGSALSEKLRQHQWNVLSTTRRKTSDPNNGFFLDLSQDPSFWKIPAHPDVGFLLAAITQVKECEKNPVLSSVVNVTNTLVLAQKLLEKNIFTVFSSSSLVLDGSVQYIGISAPVNPQVEYARQKAIVEAHLLKMKTSACVIRFPKIVNSHDVLFQGWIRDLKKGIPIFPFSDLNFSPISVGFATDVLVEVAKRKTCGLFQVSAEEQISYADAAFYLAKKLNISEKLIKPLSGKTQDPLLKLWPQYTILDSSDLIKKIGLKIPKIDNALDTILTDGMN